MPSKRPSIMIRTNEETILKFKFICDNEHRSMSNYAEKILLDKIKEFESEHGEIIIAEVIEKE